MEISNIFGIINHLNKYSLIMKKIISLIMLVILTISCNESFEEINPDKFNKKIEKRADILTPEELIILFHNYPKDEGKPEYEISSANKNDIYEITLIHNRIPDDSLLSEKIIITAKKNKNGIWSVIKILKNWKCHEGRGHNDWGTESCN